MEHGGNTHDFLTERVGELHYKEIQSQVPNSPIAPKSAESV